MNSHDVLFFQRKAMAPVHKAELPEGLRSVVSVPGERLELRSAYRDWRWLIWSGFHALHVFRNPDLTRHVLVASDGATVHRAFLFPPYARFPFMADNDLQIGDVWTHPAWRGQGLARWSIRSLAERHPEPRTIWYLTEAGNDPSIRSAQAAGFHLVAEGHRSRSTTSVIASYRIIRWC